jgi:hypothetical protein
VAVVVNGDQALAERICALLNGGTRAELTDLALRHAATKVRAARPGVEPQTALAVVQALVAMGWRPSPLDGDAPSRPLSASVATQGPPVGGSGRPEGVETLSGPCRYPECECDTDSPCGVTALTFNPAYRVARCGQLSAHGPHVVDDGPDHPRNCPGTGTTIPADPTPERLAEVAARRASLFTHPDQRRARPAPPTVGPGCICNDPPPTVDKPKNGTASRPPGWACPRHGAVI